jgi:peptide/nickel transport system permease protein
MMSADGKTPAAAGRGRLPRWDRWIAWLPAVWIAVAVAGLLWTPHDPAAGSYFDLRRSGSSAAHWMGVDHLGRDVFSRVWSGSGRTVIFGLAAASGTLLMSAALLLVERRGPRWLQTAIGATISAGLAAPVMLVAFVLLVFMPRSPATLVLACALGAVPLGFRQLHAMWIEQAGALHVLASRALGGTGAHLACFSIWPNLRPQAVALARMLFAVGVLELSGLAFLGLGGDPSLPELGALLSQNRDQMIRQPWLVLWPGMALSGLLLVVHLAGARGGGLNR